MISVHPERCWLVIGHEIPDCIHWTVHIYALSISFSDKNNIFLSKP